MSLFTNNESGVGTYFILCSSSSVVFEIFYSIFFKTITCKYRNCVEHYVDNPWRFVQLCICITSWFLGPCLKTSIIRSMLKSTSIFGTVVKFILFLSIRKDNFLNLRNFLITLYMLDVTIFCTLLGNVD